jgi:hypothetical protein
VVEVGGIAVDVSKLRNEIRTKYVEVANPFHWGLPHPGERVVNVEARTGRSPGSSCAEAGSRWPTSASRSPSPSRRFETSICGPGELPGPCRAQVGRR